MDMIVNDDKLYDLLAERIADSLLPKVKDYVDSRIEEIAADDDVVTAEYIYKNILHCNAKTFDWYLKQPGFPSMTKKSRKSFSRKAVNRWIEKHQNYA